MKKNQALALGGTAVMTLAMTGCGSFKGMQGVAELFNPKPYTVTQHTDNDGYVCAAQQPQTEANVVTIHYVSKDRNNTGFSYSETYLNANGDKVLTSNEQIASTLQLDKKKQYIHFSQEKKSDTLRTYIETKDALGAGIQTQNHTHMSFAEVRDLARLAANSTGTAAMLERFKARRTTTKTLD